LINIAPLNKINFNVDKTQVTIGGGADISRVIAAGSAAGAFILTGNCDCVGALGAYLGGGYGNLMGEYGFEVDNIVSFNLVSAEGVLKTVTAVSDRTSSGLFGEQGLILGS
jgi:hypothetical protein